VDAVPEVAPDAPLVCLPVAPPADAGDAGAADGSASRDSGGLIPQWRDWAGWTCQPCPARPVVCEDFDAVLPAIDLATGQLTVRIDPSVAEIVDASFSFQVHYAGADGGSVWMDVTVPLAVDHDTFTADVSAVVPASTIEIYGPALTVTDACGTQSTVYFAYYEYAPDVGTVLNIACEGALPA
jgi:hypothetical protein